MRRKKIGKFQPFNEQRSRNGHKGAFKVIKSLPKEIQDSIDQQLASGEGGLSITRWLQGEKKLLTDMTVESLKKTLERYRKFELREKTLTRIANAQTTLALTTLVKRLNAMEELDGITLVQKERVEKMLTHEKTLPPGILLKQTSEEIKLFKELLIDLGKMQMEVGIIPRAPKTVVGQVVSENGEVKVFTWTEEQEKMYRELENVELIAEGA